MSKQLSYAVSFEVVVEQSAVAPAEIYVLSPGKLPENCHRIVELVPAVLFFSSVDLELLLFGFLNKIKNRTKC